MTLTHQNSLRILRAEKGHVIYRNDDPQNCSEVFYLGIHDSPDNFTEITAEEAESLRAERELQEPMTTNL